MRTPDLERLYDYGYWANAKLFGVLAGLTPDEFIRCVGGGHASVRNTLVHILSAEWGWLERCGGLRRGERLRPEVYPTPDSVRTTSPRRSGGTTRSSSGAPRSRAPCSRRPTDWCW